MKNIQFFRYDHRTPKHPHSQDRRLLGQQYMHVSGPKMIFAAFEALPPPTPEEIENNAVDRRHLIRPELWETFEAKLKALDCNRATRMIDALNWDGSVVEGFPPDEYGRQNKRFWFSGAIIVNLESDGWGVDELTDCTLLDIVVRADGAPISVYSRFTRTARGKISYSDRYRENFGVGTTSNIFFPFKSRSFDDAEHIGIIHGLHEPIADAPTRKVSKVICNVPGRTFIDDIYKAITDETEYEVPVGGSVDIGFTMTWPQSDIYMKDGGEVVTNSIEVNARSDAGYFPKTRLFTSEGRGSFKFMPLGLEAGDTATIKFSVGNMSNIGFVKVKVVDA